MLTNKSHPDRIFLIGPMGAGKTTVGRILAKNLGLSYLDTDEEIEHRSGASISWIFDIEGEAGFRDREEQLVKEITKRKDIVINSSRLNHGSYLMVINTDKYELKQSIIIK